MAKAEKTDMILIRVSPGDKAAMVRAAESAGMSLSEFLRASALAYMAMKLDRHALYQLLEGTKTILHELVEEKSNVLFPVRKKMKV